MIHRIMTKFSITILAFFVCTLTSIADLAEMRKIYSSEVRRLELDNRTALLKLPQEHIAKLADLEESYRASGDLKALLAVRKERERFIADPSVKSISVVPTPARLGQLQKSYVATYAKTQSDKGIQLKELKDKYLRALERMQKDLTRQNKIEEALAVMSEIESMGSSAGGTGESAGGGGSITSTAPPPVAPPIAPVTGLSLTDIRGSLNGKVLGWNPLTHELSLEYDFSKPEQASDWRGGSIDDIDAALICDNQVAQHLLSFSSISKISFSALFRGDAKRVRLSLGHQLNIDIIGDDEPKSIVWQGSEYDPIVERFDSLRSAIANRVEFTLSDGQAGLVVNYGKAKSGPLKVALRGPVRLGLGLSRGQCAFQRLVVTGTLAPEALAQLRR